MQTLVIVLNGASSAGKSSISKAIQRLSSVPILHASLDTFTAMFDWTAIGDGPVREECLRVVLANFHATLPVLASSRFPVVVDHVFEQQAWFEAYRDSLKAKRTFFVGVRCPLSVLEQREKARGDRRIGLARWQFERVHQDKPYVLEVDTSAHSADECAAMILSFASNATNG